MIAVSSQFLLEFPLANVRSQTFTRTSLETCRVIIFQILQKATFLWKLYNFPHKILIYDSLGNNTSRWTYCSFSMYLRVKMVSCSSWLAGIQKRTRCQVIRLNRDKTDVLRHRTALTASWVLMPHSVQMQFLFLDRFDSSLIHVWKEKEFTCRLLTIWDITIKIQCSPADESYERKLALINKCYMFKQTFTF